MSLVETWIEEKDIENWEKRLSKDFQWKIIPATREHKKGRAKGGFLIGLRNCLRNVNNKIGIVVEEGLVESEVMQNSEKTTIWSVYNSGNKSFQLLNSRRFVQIHLLAESDNVVGIDRSRSRSRMPFVMRQ